MATAKDIEEVIGVSKRTIELWATKDNGQQNKESRKKLALFLKGFSREELERHMKKCGA